MRSKALILSITGVLLVLVILMSGYISLPGIVSFQARQYLPAWLDPEQVSFRVSHLSLSRVLVTDIRLADGLELDSVDVRYKVRHLSEVEIPSVTVSGLTMHAVVDKENRLTIRGLHLPEPQAGAASSTIPVMLPDEVVIRSSQVVLTARGRQWRIPFSGRARISTPQGRVDIEAMLYPLGQAIAAGLAHDLEESVTSMTLTAHGFDLSLVNGFLPDSSRVMFKGVSDVAINSPDVRRQWEVSLSRLHMAHPLSAGLENIKAVLVTDKKKVNINAHFDCLATGVPKLGLSGTAVVDLSVSPVFSARFKSQQLSELEIDHPLAQLIVTDPVFNADFRGGADKIRAEIALAASKSRLSHEAARVLTGRADIKTTVEADLTGSRPAIVSDIRAELGKVRVESGQGRLVLPECRLAGKAVLPVKGDFTGKFHLSGTRGTVRLTKQPVAASGISFTIPFSFPGVEKSTKGHFDVPLLSYGKKYTASVKGRIIQSGPKQYRFDAGAGLKQLPGMNSTVSAVIDYDRAVRVKADYRIDPYPLSSEQARNLAGPALKNLQVAATISGKGHIAVHPGNIQTRLDLSLADGSVFVPDSKLSLSGISTSLSLVDLFNLRSLPGQTLTIDSVTNQKIKITNLVYNYTIENPRSFLMEKLSFDWCGGRVYSEAIRFPSQNREYQMTLYGEQIELVQFFDQLGVFKASGKGTLNGRIPISYTDGEIRFSNGLLFSADSGGHLSIENTDRLTAGIPVNSPQFAQLELTREALKNFDFKWTRLKLNTEGNSLAINMELDGKPGRILPFQFSKELGGFVRVKGKNSGSDFKGMKLDVNLKLPFNQVMKFGNKLKTLF